MVLHGLEAAHRASELGAVLYVLDGHVQHGFSPAQHLQALAGGSPFNCPLQNGPSSVHLAQDRSRGDAHLVQDHFALPVLSDSVHLGNVQPVGP